MSTVGTPGNCGVMNITMNIITIKHLNGYSYSSHYYTNRDCREIMRLPSGGNAGVTLRNCYSPAAVAIADLVMKGVRTSMRILRNFRTKSSLWCRIVGKFVTSMPA